MSTDAHLDAILQSHYLPEYAAVIQRQLSEERARRQKFYEEMTDACKMEFIDGEVVLHSPARREHLFATRYLTILLHCFSELHGGEVQTDRALCIFQRNDYEPDVVYFSPEKCSHFSRKMMKFPAPDFVAEVLSKSTEKNDRGVKFADYASHGVSEYWIIDADAESVEQYLLNNKGVYELHLKGDSGEIESPVAKGFRIPIRAIFDPKLHRETRLKLEGIS